MIECGDEISSEKSKQKASACLRSGLTANDRSHNRGLGAADWACNVTGSQQLARPSSSFAVATYIFDRTFATVTDRRCGARVDA
jgi:hypothetical protein